MLYVKTPEEVLALIESEFDVAAPEETVSFYFLADKPALFETSDGYSYVIMPLT